ncbi:MAG: RsmD family RNA methyltransferase, partial [Spongiibacteraceae bacterium]|nr:RsmD family RNA methyltransferase [Spongiibacteraceae bacterium]
CQLVDSTPAVTRRLQEHLRTLRCDHGLVITADVLRLLATPPAEPFDVVFLDPPFRQGLLQPCVDALVQQRWLAPAAWVYTESGADEAPLVTPPGWELYRAKQAGQVSYRLWRAA